MEALAFISPKEVTPLRVLPHQGFMWGGQLLTLRVSQISLTLSALQRGPVAVGPFLWLCPLAGVWSGVFAGMLCSLRPAQSR